MAKKGLNDFPEANPTEAVTGKGVAVLLSFFAVFAALYALSYPLAKFANQPLTGIFLSDPFSISFFVLALVGLGLVVMYFRSYRTNDLIASLFLAALVGLAVQAKYWYNGWTPYIPYYPPVVNSLEVFFITLGAIGLLKARNVLHFRLAENDDRASAWGLVLGIALGIPFAIVNVILLVFISNQSVSLQDVPTQAIIALRPGIIEEVAFRLLFMGLALAVLLKYLPKKIAIISAIFMAVVFHSALHLPDLVASNPLAAAGMIVFTSVLFGLPMALLAYKRDIETAIGFHWVIDAVRFSLGL